MIETMSLSISLLSLTIAVLCMINVKYVSYFFVKLTGSLQSDRYFRPQLVLSSFPPPLCCPCFFSFRRLHLPRNLLHMHLFVAFILRSIVKLIFIHLIVGGYPRSMITYTRDECGNTEILSKSSQFIHVGDRDEEKNGGSSSYRCMVHHRFSVVECYHLCSGTQMPFLKRSSFVKRCFCSLR